MSTEKRKHDVFISYSTNNSDIANKVCYVLEQNNIPCWIAPRNIASGQIYVDEISDAIKSTKVVVLIFSEFSQESKYVTNEIKMAFSRKIPVVSFNVDDTLPKGKMEYYLKVSQWLTAYPNPENVLAELVDDVRLLCEKHHEPPVIVDLSNYKPEDFSKHKKDPVSLILLFTPLYWASFIYMGIISGRKLWTLSGFIYLVPSLMCLAILFQIQGALFIFYPMLVLFAVLFVMFWVLAIIHGFVIRNEFLTRKSVLRFAASDKELFDYLYGEYIQI